MKNKFSCEVKLIHEDAVLKTESGMPSQAAVRKAALTFRMIGNRTRLNLLCALSLRELCVCDLANILSMGQSAISHQLRALRDARLVKFRRQGKIAYYSIGDGHAIGLIRAGIGHAKE